jgi:hypothetical protein
MKKPPLGRLLFGYFCKSVLGRDYLRAGRPQATSYSGGQAQVVVEAVGRKRPL